MPHDLSEALAIVPPKSVMKLLWLLSPWIISISEAFGATFHVSQQALSSVPLSHQFRTVQEAANRASAGDKILIHSGIYRESVVVAGRGTPRKPIRFEAAPRARVVVTGADRLTKWHREPGNVLSAKWPYRFIGWSKINAHPDDEYHRLIGRAEQVAVNGRLLRQVLQREQLSPGSFYVDLEKQKLYVSLNSGQKIKSVRIEGSTRPVLWDCKGDHVLLRGIHFRYAANAAQQGAVIFKGRGDTVEDCSFEHMNGPGAVFVGQDQIARNCIFQDNGQLGFGASGAHNLLIAGCTIRNNNTKGFNHQWEAGGDKIVLSRNVVLENSRFIGNHGPGIWFDIGNENATVRNCLVADNEDAGIYYETSYGLHAHDNVVTGNGFASTAGAWGAQAGIVLSSSPNCVIERNLMVGNREGFDFREQSRTTHRIDDSDSKHEESIWNHDDRIVNNVIADNRDAQTRGWFDVGDERHWPRKQPADSAAMSLDTLNLVMQQNVYALEGNQSLFIWGVDWRRHASYSTIPEVQKALGLENDSQLVGVKFRELGNRDFRLPRQSPVFEMNCYPRGQVPDVKLGPE